MADSSFISVGSLLHAAAARWAWRWYRVTATRVYRLAGVPEELKEGKDMEVKQFTNKLGSPRI